MKNIITGHRYDGCWSCLSLAILTRLQNMEQTRLMFLMPKISTVVLKTSYWYMVGFKCNDVSTCWDVIFRISIIVYFIITVIIFIYCTFTFLTFSYFCHRCTEWGGRGGLQPPPQILGSNRKFGQSHFLKTFLCFFY